MQLPRIATVAAVFTTVALSSLKTGRLAAQVQSGVARPTFRLLETVALPDEKVMSDAVLSRLRVKFTSDPAFVTRVEDAALKGDVATATALVAAAGQLRRDQVWIGRPVKRLGMRRPSASFVRFASAFNPFYILFAGKTLGYCIGNKAECSAALIKAGYTDPIF